MPHGKTSFPRSEPLFSGRPANRSRFCRFPLPRGAIVFEQAGKGYTSRPPDNQENEISRFSGCPVSVDVRFVVCRAAAAYSGVVQAATIAAF